MIKMLPPVLTIQVVAFLDLLAAGLIVPQVIPQARSLGGSLVVGGFIGSIYSGFQLLSSPITGSLSDLKGRSKTMLMSLCLSGVAYVLLGLANSVFVFLLLRSVLGVTKHTQLLAKTLIPVYAKDQNELSSAYGKLYSLKQAGMTVGPIISGHIMGAYPENGFAIIGFIVGAIFAVNAGLIRSLPNVEKEEKKKRKEPTPITPALLNVAKTNLKESVDQFHKINWTKYWDVFSFKLLISFCLGVFLTNYVLFVKTKHSVTPVTKGYIISVLSASSSITSFFVARINNYYVKDKDYTERNLHAFALLTLSLLGVAFAPDVSMFVAFIIPLGVASTMGNLITQEIILCKTEDDQRGTVLGVVGNLKAITGTIAPLVSGILGEYFGVLRVVYVSIILAAVGTYKSYVMRTKSIDTKNK